MRIIHERKRIHRSRFTHNFARLDRPGCFFSFDCDEQGVPAPDLAPAARENLRQCLDGTLPVRDEGIRTERWSFVQPAVGLCSCDTEVELHGFTNTCDGCDTDYNSSGQRLAPRSCWGEETGESLSDILNIP